MYSKSPSGGSGSHDFGRQPAEPDMSHLSLEEQQIIKAVLDRQRAEEQAAHSKYNTLPLRSVVSAVVCQQGQLIANSSPLSVSSRRSAASTSVDGSLEARPGLHSCHSITDLSAESKQRYGSVDTGRSCDVCARTKFTHTGSGHTCFDCKRRCCVKCAYRYTTKTKQFWSCADCKRRQDALLRSGKWLTNSHLSLTNKKHYASDYILSRAAEVGVGLDLPTDELTSLVNTIHSNFNERAKKALPSVPGAGRKLPVPGARQLPVPSKGPLAQVKYNTYIQTSNSAQSVPELARDTESFTEYACREHTRSPDSE